MAKGQANGGDWRTIVDRAPPGTNWQQPQSNLRFEMPAGGPWGGGRISRPAPQQLRRVDKFIGGRIDPGYQQPQANPSLGGLIAGAGASLSDEEKMRLYEERKARYGAVPGSNRLPYWRDPPGSNPMPPWAQGPHQQLIQDSRIASQLGNLGVGTAGLNSLFASDTSVSSPQQRPMSAGTPRNMDRFNQAVENAGLGGIDRSVWNPQQRQDFRAARRAIPRMANGGLVSQMRNRNPLPASRWSLPHYRNLV